MKKPIIISIAIAALVLVLAVWVYLFLYGAPDNDGEVLTNLGFDLDSQPVDIAPNSNIDDLITVDSQGSALRQLTTRPVAGFGSLGSSTEAAVRYVEAGTGHVYEIKIATGEEQRLTNTTIPRTVSAVFSPDATTVVIVSETGYVSEIFVGNISDNTSESALIGTNLPPDAQDITFIDNQTIGYTRPTLDGTTGYRYNTITKDQSIDFTAPFLSVTTLFTETETHIYNRHNPELEGSLFAVSNTAFNAVTPNEYGLSTLVHSDWYIQSYTQNNTFYSRAYNRDSKTSEALPISVIPEKCDFANSSLLWCAAPINTVPYTYQKEWYQGIIRSNDMLWEIDLRSQSARLALSPQITIGREIDITNMSYAELQAVLYFTNKNDNTLWLYDPSIR